MQINRLPEHVLRNDATLADLALMGFELGKQCAQRITRGYAVSPLQPDKSPLEVVIVFNGLASQFVEDQRAKNGLTDAGEAAYRAGYQRGFDTQLHHPGADVVLKISRPSHG